MDQSQFNQIVQSLDRQKEWHLETLFTLLRQPSISTQNIGVRKCASLLSIIMEECGIDTQILETKGQPVVFGEVSNPENTLTVLFYGHYDVQPPEPLDLWQSDPFEPTIRDKKIVARGVGDNKGQLIAHVLAVHTLLKELASLPINIKFLFEGEEEMGSVNLASFVEENQDLLKADIAYTADGPMEGDDQPSVTLGNRGILYSEIRAFGANRDNHSGNKGNIAPDPAMAILNLIRSMINEEGEVLIKDFYSDVWPPTAEEMAHLSTLPFHPDKTAKVVGMNSLDMTKEEYYTSLCFKPTFTIAGIESGYTGEGTKTIIPSQAKVKLDMRLAPGQDPDMIYSLLEEHVNRFSSDCTFTIEKLSAVKPSKTSMHHPLVQEVIEAVNTAYNKKPVVLPALGGTGPMYVFTDILNIPSVTVPYANVDEDNHAPNENMGLKEFFNGIRATSSTILRLGELTQNSTSFDSSETQFISKEKT